MGVVSDAVIARHFNCSLFKIRKQRLSLNITAIPRERGLKSWSIEKQKRLELGYFTCLKCGIEKLLQEFPSNPNSYTKCYPHCRECKINHDKNRRLTLRQNYINLLGGCCQFCKYCEFSSALHFHHVNGDKQFKISTLLSKNYEDNIVRKEIDKCCLLCSNCHSAYHSKQLKLIFVKSKFGYSI